MEKGFFLWVLSLWALVRKDLVDEFRSRYAFNAVLMFAVTTLLMVSFSTGVYFLDPALHAAFLWIIIFFSSLVGVGKSFAKEEEKGTSFALRLSAPPEVVYLGKLLFNLLLVGALAALVLPLYYIMMAPPSPGNLGLLLLAVFLGVFCLAGSTTILAAIVAKAGGKNALLSILSFPVLLPVLITAISATKSALEQPLWFKASSELQFLLSYGVVITVASLLLFAYVWND